MDQLTVLVSKANSFIWGLYCLIPLLCGTGLYFTLKLNFVQIRKFGLAVKYTFGGITLFGKRADKDGMSSFQALATAIAAQVGTGNLAGAATAIAMGGPGAIFWMWIAAFFGMATIFAEAVLAQVYKEKLPSGQVVGGPAYYISRGLKCPKLAMFFAVALIIALGFIGNMVQSNSTAEGISMGFGVPHLVTGVVIAALVGLVIWGGLTRIATVTVYMVPFMAIFYILGAFAIIVAHYEAIPGAISSAFYGAFFDPMALPGALAGWSVKIAITRGISRGVFSNEAGLGSAPMVHCTARTDHPVRQGLYGLFEVFMDTIIICNLTAITILATGVLTGQPELTGAQLSLAAFSSVLGPAGVMILSVALSLFALSTILGWYWYAETALVYLSHGKSTFIKPFKFFWMLLIVLGAWGGGEALANLWNLSDTLNGMMAIPNLIGLLLLTKELRALVKDFDQKRRDGTLKV
ncbi:MAG: sodium:alanine symporter family protein [Cloacibacillus sp.]